MKLRKIIILFIIITMGITPILSTASSIEKDKLNAIKGSQINADEQEINLLFGETFLNITAIEDVNSPFNITYIAPLNYNNQAPILFELCDDSSADILSFRILNDTNPPNKVLKFLIGPMGNGTISIIHFRYWVYVKNENYVDLPRYVKMPKENELPESTKKWLNASKSVQSDNILIKLKAKQVKGFTRNLITLANKIVLTSTGLLHRRFMLISMGKIRNFLFPIVREKFGESDWIPLQDAFSSLFIRGSCYAQTHLGVALFRANNVPARSIIITPTFEQVMEQHVICEYYCPNYGWITTEPIMMSTPPKGIIEYIVERVGDNMGFNNFTTRYESKSHIILRINFPEDELKAGNGVSYYGGMEPYLWLDDNSLGVHTYPYTTGYIKKEYETDIVTADFMLNLTKKIYEQHSKYIGTNLIGDDLIHYDAAISAQQNAINCFKQSQIQGYIDNMNIAFDEYSLIS